MWQKEYENALLSGTQYSGSHEAGVKKFSASMLGDDILQNYYRMIYGTKDVDEFGANTFGSLYQLGVDAALKDNAQYINGQRLSYTLTNGWIVSGEIDNLDMKNHVIIDNKVTTGTTIKSIAKEGKDHRYALQLGVYKLLAYKHYGKMFDTALAVIDKSASYFKPNATDVMNYVDVETHTIERIEELLMMQTDLLEAYMETNKEPDQCADLFFYKQKDGSTKKMRCLHYCSYAKECSYYNDHKDFGTKLIDKL